MNKLTEITMNPSHPSSMPYSADVSQPLLQTKLVYIQAELRGHVLEIRLNRPEKRNAFDAVLVRELAFAMSYAHYQANVWAVLIAANGCITASARFQCTSRSTGRATIMLPPMSVVESDPAGGFVAQFPRHAFADRRADW